MGKTIAKHTRYLYVKHNVLYIGIDSAPLRQELLYAKQKIIQMLNDRLEEEYIKDIIFK